MKSKRPLIIVLLIWSLAPFLWQLYTSFCTPDAISKPFTLLSSRFTFDNYKLIISSEPSIWKYIVNSLIVGLTTTFLTLILATPAAYSLSRINKKAAYITRIMLLLSALFPYVILFLALLEMARALNLSNSLLALAIPYSSLSLPLAILILSSAINDLPMEMEEAAKLEGLKLWDRLRLIFLPIIRPALASTSILVFIFSWNEYPISLTWISKPDLLTLPVAIARIAGSSVYLIPYGAYAAATVLGSLPLIFLVIIFQKQIISGLTQGAIKG